MENNKQLPPEDGSELVGDRVRIFQRGEIWYANFQHGKRQHRESLKTKSKKEARRRAAARLIPNLSKIAWEPEKRAASIEEAAAAYIDYLDAEHRAAKTLCKYRFVLGKGEDARRGARRPVDGRARSVLSRRVS